MDTLKIDAVYRALLGSLSLSVEHNDNLLARGLPQHLIDVLMYKTLPLKRQALVDQLSANNDLAGVPGFFKADKKWKLSGMQGMLIPVRDSSNRIVGIKVRVDKPQTKSKKYLQISSNPGEKNGEVKYPRGTKAQTAIHYPNITKSKTTLRITEGELKADIATYHSDEYTISLPGVSMWEWGVEVAKELQPEKILISFDADKNNKMESYEGPGGDAHPVGECCANLYMALKNLNFNVFIEDWDPKNGKGIDDVLVGGQEDQITLMDETQATDFCKEALEDNGALGWIYIIQTQIFFCREKDYHYSEKQFNAFWADKVKKKGLHSDRVLQSKSFLKVHSPVYEPGKDFILQDERGRPVANIWIAHDIDAIEGDVEMFLDHAEYIISDEVERKIYLDYLAFNIQFPGKKIKWAALLKGGQGVGKSYFGEVMVKILGKNNVNKPSNETVHEPYTTWQKSCSLVIIEEMMSRGRQDLMNKLKPIITETTTTIREMRCDAYDQPNRFNLLMFTNHDDAIVLEKDDRRYYCIKSDAKAKKTDYYKSLWDWTDKNVSQIYHWFLQRDLSKFEPNAHAPMTTAKAEIIGDSKSDLEMWIAEAIEDSIWPFNAGEIIGTMHLIDALKKKHFAKKVTVSSVGRILSALGHTTTLKVKLSNGNKIKVRPIRRHEMWASAENDVIAKEYEKWSAESQPGGNPLMDMEPI